MKMLGKWDKVGGFLVDGLENLRKFLETFSDIKFRIFRVEKTTKFYLDTLVSKDVEEIKKRDMSMCEDVLFRYDTTYTAAQVMDEKGVSAIGNFIYLVDRELDELIQLRINRAVKGTIKYNNVQYPIESDVSHYRIKIENLNDRKFRMFCNKYDLN